MSKCIQATIRWVAVPWPCKAGDTQPHGQTVYFGPVLPPTLTTWPHLALPPHLPTLPETLGQRAALPEAVRLCPRLLAWSYKSHHLAALPSEAWGQRSRNNGGWRVWSGSCRRRRWRTARSRPPPQTAPRTGCATTTRSSCTCCTSAAASWRRCTHSRRSVRVLSLNGVQRFLFPCGAENFCNHHGATNYCIAAAIKFNFPNFLYVGMQFFLSGV